MHATHTHTQPIYYSIQVALVEWETYVNIAKASEVDNVQKWNKQ